MIEDLAGALVSGGHLLRQRVYYEDTDFSGRVYHARYLHFLERGRTDFLRLLGVEQGGSGLGVDGEGLGFVVRRMEIDFLAPAVMDDILEIGTRPEKTGGAKLVLDQLINVGDRALVSARVTIAVIDRTGRARRLPASLAARFAAV